MVVFGGSRLSHYSPLDGRVQAETGLRAFQWLPYVTEAGTDDGHSHVERRGVGVRVPQSALRRPERQGSTRTHPEHGS